MTELRIVSREDAISAGSLRYFSGVPCKNGHVSERYVKNSSCCSCSAERSSRWQRANAKFCAEKNRDWRAKNREKYTASNKNWRVSNPDIMRKIAAETRAKKKNATPKWLSPHQRREILLFYKIAVGLETATGQKHNVDHIVPLKGKNVSGLHVPWNLRILTAEENRRKHNKFDV